MKKANRYKELAVIILLVAFSGGCGSSGSYGTYDPGSEGGVEFTNEYSSPAELGVGDIMYVNFGDSDSALIDFAGVSADAKFYLVIGSANESGVSTSVSLLSDLSAPIEKSMAVDVAESRDHDAEEIMSSWLRAAEYDLAMTEPLPAAASVGMKGMSAMKAVGVGAVENFRVLSSLASTTTYTTVDGEARCVKNNVIIYIDQRVGDDMIDDSDVETLCSNFDRVAAAEQELLGDASDVNGDGKVAVLMTPQINKLGSMGGGIITGYFWAGDLYERSSGNPVSNFREMIYTLVPDPKGAYGTVVTKDFVLNNLIPAVLPHELQHAINYNQHVFVNGTPPEANWLNEGLSHLTEDLMGYGHENPSRYALFLSNTNLGGIVAMGQPNIYERGASYLFLRYLYEQASNGNSFVRSLVSTGLTGVDNIEAAFGGGAGFSKFHEFLARWTVAVAVTDGGITNDPRFVYRDRVMNSTTGHWEGVCLRCSAEDGRGTLLSGVDMVDYGFSATSTIVASAAQYFNIDGAPDQIRVEGSAGAGNFGVLIRQQ